MSNPDGCGVFRCAGEWQPARVPPGGEIAQFQWIGAFRCIAQRDLAADARSGRVLVNPERPWTGRRAHWPRKRTAGPSFNATALSPEGDMAFRTPRPTAPARLIFCNLSSAASRRQHTSYDSKPLRLLRPPTIIGANSFSQPGGDHAGHE